MITDTDVLVFEQQNNHWILTNDEVPIYGVCWNSECEYKKERKVLHVKCVCEKAHYCSEIQHFIRPKNREFFNVLNSIDPNIHEKIVFKAI